MDSMCFASHKGLTGKRIDLKVCMDTLEMLAPVSRSRVVKGCLILALFELQGEA